MPTLTEELVEIVRAAAAPIAPAMRPRFYAAVDDRLRGCELGPGLVARACAEAQKTFILAPPAPLDGPTSPSKQPPRSPFRRPA